MNRLNYLLTLVLIACNCMANTPVSLNVSGTRGTISSLTPPQRQYNASLEGATAESYEWTISGDVDSTSNDNTATITFTGNAPDDGSLPSASIKCKAKYRDADNNLKTLESDKINVKWFCGRLSTRIEGESLVLRDSEHTYSAKIYTNLPGSKTYSWSWYENGVKKTSQNENISINFQDITGNSITLNCKIGVGDTQLDASPFVIDISDGNYILTASRKDYKINDQHEHYRTYTDDNTVYIHFNVDDDDLSASMLGYNLCGCDYEQKYSNESNTIPDDDLCELKIDVEFKEGLQLDFSELSITIITPKCIRIWRNKLRHAEHLLIAPGQTNSWNNANEILGKTFFVEGMVYDSAGPVEIQLGNKTRKLLYKTCSVGNKNNQPTIEERKFIKNRFPNLIDCEWGILRKGDNYFYNCIAFSVDPYLKTFKDVVYDNTYLKNWMSLQNHGIKNGFPFYVKNITDINENPPTLSKDNFFVEITLGMTEQLCWFLKEEYMKNENHTLFTNFYKMSEIKYPNGKYDVIFTSNNKGFKRRADEIMSRFNNICPCKLVYIIYMNTFGDQFITNQLTQGNIDSFFESDLWKNNNNELNLAYCSKTDSDRKVVYYSKFHAARRASLLSKAEYNSPTNRPSDWIIFASKIGNCEAILHLEEQLAGFQKEEYGRIKRAYK